MAIFSVNLEFYVSSLDVRKNLQQDVYKRKVLNFVIILAQAVIMINEVPGWIAYESVLFLLVFVINLKDLLKTVKKMLRR